ncbi:hypothetical protein [Mesorhizobium sp. CN2-181]|uniref:hypothetical protein n=1 Tax=Mesorhizobium yinganensis TaxID=3157707 RepID=UPI0032B86A6F
MKRQHAREPRNRPLLDELRGRLSSLAQEEAFGHNLFARYRLRDSIFRQLRSEMRDPASQGNADGYFVTICDRRTTSDFDGPIDFREIRKIYHGHLLNMNFIGMIEPALYVSCQKVFGVDRRLHYHLHAIVWNCTDRLIQDRCANINDELLPMVSYTETANWKPISPGTLRTVIEYIGKLPAEQTQIWKRPSERLKQQSRQINGINSVRVLREMANFKLDDLLLSGRRGLDIARRALRDVRED